MAAEIPNLVKRNGIYCLLCRIPSTLTNGRVQQEYCENHEEFE